MAEPCVVGIDVGGSHSRAVLATLDGRTLGTGRAGGGNPTVFGAGGAIANIVAALQAALGDVPGERVAACVVGIAGVSTLMADPRAPRVLEQAWAEAGLACPVRVVSDVTVSFAAGTSAPDGILLVSGTGAVAARMRDRLPALFRDGYGWLLGDDGSGVWIGRQAARATIAAADGRQPMAELATSVLEHLLHTADGANAANSTNVADSANVADGTDAANSTDAADSANLPDKATIITTTNTNTPPLPLATTIGEGFTLRGRRRAAELVRAVTAQPTLTLAGLAPLVMAAHELGDPAAERIVREAARALLASLTGVGPVAGEPVVLGGSVLVSRSPVFGEVTAAIKRRWPDSPIGLAADGAAGATWLAARDVLGPRAAAAVHAAFTGRRHRAETAPPVAEAAAHSGRNTSRNTTAKTTTNHPTNHAPNTSGDLDPKPSPRTAAEFS